MSRKGRDLAATEGAASMCFYWRETAQQVNLSGKVSCLSDAASDDLFAERPLAAQATTSIPRQGETLVDEDALRCAAEELVALGRPLPRPATWSGYILIPSVIEFWHGSVDRLHRRLQYVCGTDGWAHARLQP